MEAAIPVRTQWCSFRQQLAFGQGHDRRNCTRVQRLAPARALFGRKPQQGSQKARVHRFKGRFKLVCGFIFVFVFCHAGWFSAHTVL